MRRIVGLLLALVMLLGLVAGCADGHFRFAEDTSLTRGEWIEQLAATFGLDEYDEQEPYFSDISEEDAVFAPIQSCYEWGILRDVSRKFKKENGASLKFVVTTAVYATGVDLANYEGDTDEEKAIQYAQQNGIAPAGANYGKWATGEQCEEVLSAAKLAYLNQEITPIDRVVMNPEVSDQRVTNKVQANGENQYTFVDMEPVVGDVYIAPGTEENPEGVAIKVTDVVDHGDGTYSVETTTPELDEVVEEIEYAGVVVPEIEDVIPGDGVVIQGSAGGATAGSNLTIMDQDVPQISGTSLAAYVGAEDASEETQSQGVTTSNLGGSNKQGLSFTASVNLTKGTVSLNPEWENVSANIEQLLTSSNAGTASPDAGELFSKTSVFPDRTLFGPDVYSNDAAIKAYEEGKISADELKEELKKYQNEDGTEKIPNLKNKFSGGYEIIGSISIKDLYIVPQYKIKTAKILGVDTGIPTGIERLTVETNYTVEGSLKVKGHIENEFTVCSIPVPVGGAVTVTVEVVIYTELNGEVGVKLSISNNTKTEYIDGKTKKTTADNSSVSLEGGVKLEFGPKVKAKLSAFAIPLVDVGVSAAVQGNLDASASLNTEWTETDEAFIVDRRTVLKAEIAGYIPIVKVTLGTDKSTLANKLNIKFTWTLIGSNGEGILGTAKKWDIWNGEAVIWQDHLEIPKDPEETSEPDSSQDPQESDSWGSNMDISTYFIHLRVGESCGVDLEYPTGYSAEDFTWESSDPSVVAVKNGEISAKHPGTASIMARSTDGKYYANCAVYVGTDETSGGAGGR